MGSEQATKYHGEQRQHGGIHKPVLIEGDDPPTESVSGLLFGSVADRYERYRLGYPDELFAAVLRYAGRPIGAAPGLLLCMESGSREPGVPRGTRPNHAEAVTGGRFAG